MALESRRMTAALERPDTLPALKVLADLGVDFARGLSDAEVATRRAQSGENSIARRPRRPLLLLLLDQFRNLITALLAGAAGIAWIKGDTIESLAVVAVLVLNAAIGFGMEWQAGRALDALRDQTRSRALARRNGAAIAIAAEELVPGDIVLVGAGDRVPADLRLVEAAGLMADEASLTGESRSVAKDPEPVGIEAVLAERRSALFLGTAIVAGRGVAVVVETGERTELGRIGQLVREVPDARTPLQGKLDALGKRLALLVIAIGGIVSLAGWLRGDDGWMMAEVGITLAVAAIPEALPAVTTFILAFGVLRMARQKAIVRRLAAVETLGSTTVICSDKTGTLTLNRMTVSESRPAGPDGERLLREVAALCNDATLATGDPTEVALIEWASQAGLDLASLHAREPRVAEHPFDPRVKRMITIHSLSDGGFRWALKGSTEVVLDACAIRAEARDVLVAVNDELAGRGLRVLAFAHKRTETLAADSENGFSFLGFVGMIDPPRPGAAQAVAAARRAGIRLIMLTGDQVETARAIARDLVLVDGEPRVTHARELVGADAHRVALATDVFARVSPEDKYRIVEALQASGEVVAVTGDGVNDAPALKKADVGIAMGERGTEVAQEAADIVLADDNFHTIVAAIEGGRTIYANLEKFVHLMFSHNLSEVLTIFVAIVLGWPLPLLPLQILWLNLVTDVFPAFALALEPPEPGILDQPPRPATESLVSARFVGRIFWQASMLAGITLAIYAWALARFGEGDLARTLALMSMVGVQIGQMFNCRSLIRPAIEGLARSPYLFGAAAAVMLLQLVALGVAPLRELLGLEFPPVSTWPVLALSVPLPIAIVEIQKAIARRAASSLAAVEVG